MHPRLSADKSASTHIIHTLPADASQAFISFLNLHMLFSNRNPEPSPAAKACAHTLPDEIQHRLGGAFGAAAERNASELEEAAGEDDDGASRVRLHTAILIVGTQRSTPRPQWSAVSRN